VGLEFRRWWLAAPALTPVASLHPPFQDWAGHLGVVGCWLHPEAVAPFVVQQHWLGPNGALYLVIYALALVVPKWLASAVVLAAVLVSVPLASLWLCRSVEADERLAILALPIAFARPTYAGFIPNVAATAMLIAGLAAYLSYRRSGKRRDLVLQVVLQIGIATMHTFVALASCGLLLVLAAMDAKRARRAALVGAGSAAAGALVLLLLFRGSMAGPIRIVVGGELVHSAGDFWSWLIGFRGGTIADDLMQIAWLAPVAAALALRREWDEARIRLAAVAIAAVIAFLMLPMDIGPPVNWWGARGRLPAIVVLLAIPLVPNVRWIRAAQAAALAISLYSLVELGIWERTVMRGFDDAIASLPRGRALSVLWYDVDPERRFPGAPLGHAGGWYVFERGGGSAQSFFEPDVSSNIAGSALPFRAQRAILGPPWGIAELFDWSEHGDAELFLVRTREDAPQAPFYGPQLEGMQPGGSGPWRYWTR
jgi:hypothetical protein